MSAMGLVVGIVLVCIGLFVAIPSVGTFGVFWTVMAVAITGYHAVNLLSERGVAHAVVDLETSTRIDARTPRPGSPEQRLAELDGLKRKGLVRDEEYEEQRKRILDEI